MRREPRYKKPQAKQIPHSVVTSNRFSPLLRDEEATRTSELIYKQTTSFKYHHQRKKRNKHKVEHESDAVSYKFDENISNPHSPSLFIPGKIIGREVQFLIDTGCTTNLLARHVYEKSPPNIKKTLQPIPKDKHGTLADGSKICFDGLLRVTCRVRNLKVTDTFMVCLISEDSILGMPFLTKHNCSLQFNQASITIDNK